jgi:polyhydroxybutyrate depolymerase
MKLSRFALLWALISTAASIDCAMVVAAESQAGEPRLEAPAAPKTGPAAPAPPRTDEPERRTWKIDGLEREAIIYKPAVVDGKAPLVFGFHGHGGNMNQAARSFGLHDEWPEAVTVYMQGVPTPGQLTDPEGKRNGWQHSIGAQDDRDLKFFDAVLATMKESYSINPKRVYCTGHSNGGGFTYLLWAARPDTFTAVAPSGAAGAVRLRSKLKPCSCLHLAGEADPLVKFEWQEASMKVVREVNGCVGEPVKWAEGCLEYRSKQGTPFVSFIHPGGHRYPAEAPKLIVKFFQEHIGEFEGGKE